MTSSFQKLVSNLSFSPSADSQLGFYLRRLKQENLTRKLGAFFALWVIVLQVAVFAAPPTPVTANSPFDIILGGFKDQKDLLYIYDHGNGVAGQSASQLQAIFNYFHITRQNLADGRLSAINSADHSLWSLGRLNHSGPDKIIVINGTKFYQHPLYYWKDNTKFAALVGKRNDGTFFAVLKDCGNIVIKLNEVAPPIKPTPAPTLGPPNILLLKEAFNLSQLSAEGTAINADDSQAKAGDIIQYVLHTRNIGETAKTGYVVEEQIADILEYADVVDNGGGNLAGGVLTWPAVTIKPQTEYVVNFKVQIKDPIPTNPRSVSDPLSYDLRLDNVYGNAINIFLPAPVPKQIEQTSENLPQTGPAENALVLVFMVLVLYFFNRNRQLLKEVKILRNEHLGS